jgi:integrase
MRDMKKIKNPNRPKKGQRITVEPIRRVEDVKAIARMLHDSPRNHLLFILGVNNGLRAGDLLKLRVKQVRYLKPGETLTIKEGKTGKDNVLAVNKTVYRALQHYLETLRPGDEDFLFKSKKGNNRPITIQAVNNYIKKWTKAIRLRGNYGAHTLRKTWGYIQRTKFGVGFELICRRFNHASPAVTMRYLGVEDKEVNGILMNNEIG